MKKFALVLVFLAATMVSFSVIKKPTKAVSKSLAFPVAGKSGKIKSLWGANRGGGTRKHKGIDIYAHKGTPVVAICDGVIVNKDHTINGGKTLWLKAEDHPWTAYYAHLDKQLVREGQYVHKGQVIGTVGNSGNARTTPSHLHFGISPGKGWVNPLPYVKYSPKVAAPKQTHKKRAHTSAKKKVANKKNRRH
jgi:murein DD-endopeptidase MepM/ murein hydrolase activator NlpD